MDKHRKRVFLILICIIILAICFSGGCKSRQSAVLNNRMKEKAKATDNTTEVTVTEIPYTNQNVTQQEEVNDPEYQAFMSSVLENSTPTPEADSKADEIDFGPPDSAGRIGYHFDLEKDKKTFDKEADIVVGDKFYATQINDWYSNFDQYEGKSVEIEGYYIDEYKPYTFIGRYGPSCPYCNGGYVSFEIYTQDDLSSFKSGEDWIKVKGILRQGEEPSGVFYYIEILTIDKMDQIGKDTVSD